MISSEQEKAQWVRGMFGSIAGRYDLLNHVLSFNLDKRWRAKAVRRLEDRLTRPGARVLDLCCGTGDLWVALQERGANVLGSDFCHPMLIEAQRKKPESPLFEADALALPIASDSLDIVTCAFGFRNLANHDKGLNEFLRVLKPGGVAAILEFSQPTNATFAALYGFFSNHVLPRIGGVVSGSREAYSYLPQSIQTFPGAEELAARMKAAGFKRVEFDRMTAGAVALHLGYK